jgi:hypothetical protein
MTAAAVGTPSSVSPRPPTASTVSSLQHLAAAGRAGTSTEASVATADLAALDKNPAATRIAALKRIVSALPGDLGQMDLPSRPAQTIARYLLTIRTNAELEEVLPKIAPLANSRAMLLALADRVDQDTTDQQATEAVVGALLVQPLRFAKDDPWRLTCRKLLLRKMLSLDAADNPGNQAADIVRTLYAEQAVLFGLEPAQIKDLQRPSQMLQKLIGHVAAIAGNGTLAQEDREYLDRIDDQLLVAQFLAQNDLEHHALLQRVWIRVLPIYLAQQSPDRGEAMRHVRQELTDADRLARTVLEQLRAGEVKILRVWTIALDLK